MSESVVKGVRPVRWVVLKHGQGGIIGEIRFVQHLVLSVATGLQEGRPHAANVFVLDPAVQVQYLSLSANFLEPFILGKLLPEAMSVCAITNNKSVKSIGLLA